jgi:Arm DNA-binding domain
MPAYKYKNRAGRTLWGYMYSGPGSTRENRKRISRSGFATKREAEEAERNRGIEEGRKAELANIASIVTGPLPRTLSMLLEEFFEQHVDEKLAPKTIERSQPKRSGT